jgi:hypothetical protein
VTASHPLPRSKGAEPDLGVARKRPSITVTAPSSTAAQWAGSRWIVAVSKPTHAAATATALPMGRVDARLGQKSQAAAASGASTIGAPACTQAAPAENAKASTRTGGA